MTKSKEKTPQKVTQKTRQGGTVTIPKPTVKKSKLISEATNETDKT